MRWDTVMSGVGLAGSMSERFDLITYDLDGTLIDGTAFLLVARKLGFEAEVLHHDARFRSGEITLEECFDIEFEFLKGVPVAEVHAALAEGTWFPGIKEAVAMLKERGIRVAVLTDNPDFITDYLTTFGIDEAVCSRGVVEEGKVTGEVHPSFDKWGNLERFLEAEDIDPMRVCHIGNDVNDVGVWENVGLGVAVEPTGDAVRDAADACFERIDDHVVIAEAILATHSE